MTTAQDQYTTDVAASKTTFDTAVATEFNALNAAKSTTTTTWNADSAGALKTKDDADVLALSLKTSEFADHLLTKTTGDLLAKNEKQRKQYQALMQNHQIPVDF